MASQFGVVAPAPASARQDTLAWKRERREREARSVGTRNIGCALRDALATAQRKGMRVVIATSSKGQAADAPYAGRRPMTPGTLKRLKAS